MDRGDLLASPRKKLKVHHTPSISAIASVTMAEGVASSEPPHAASEGQDRRDKEIQCGITEYVSLDVPGFTATFKKRYTDFLVNEILPNGTVVHLDNLKHPKAKSQVSQAAAHTTGHQDSTKKHPVSDLSQCQLSKATESAAFDPASVNNAPPSPPVRKTTPPHLRLPSAQLPTSVQDGLAAQASPTKINELEQGVRVREKHVLYYSGGGLNVVNDKNRPELQGSEEVMPVAEQDANPAPQAEMSTDNNTRKETSYASQVGTSTVGGWQAFALSNTEAGVTNKDAIPQTDGTTEADGPQPMGSNRPGAGDLLLITRDRDVLSTAFDDKAIEQMLDLCRQKIADPKKKHSIQVRSTKPTSRESRFKVHEAVRRVFQRQLNSTTDSQGVITINAAAFPGSDPRNNAGGAIARQQPQAYDKTGARWSALGGDHVHFSLFKVNRETNETLSYMAKMSHLNPKTFKTAGIKDRRGVTVQRVSAYRVEVDKLISAAQRTRDMRIGNFEYHTQGLQNGDLSGNQFEITLRDCRFPTTGDQAGTTIDRQQATVAAAAKHLTSHGFLNYYGLQRFGTHATATHVIGRYMLQGDFKSACDGVLSFDPFALAAAQQSLEDQHPDFLHDDKARALALHVFATTGKSEESLKHLPFKFRGETAIIRHLARQNQENDFQGALAAIDRKLRSIYVHAYQSLVWNVIAGARWRLYGNKVMPGDLVLIDDHPDPTKEASTAEVSSSNAPAVDQDGELLLEAETGDRASAAEGIFARARPVMESELKLPGCNITVFDIVLPLPGYDILYPANASGAIYKDYMGSMEGGHLDPYNMRRKWRECSLSGGYRKLLARPLGDIEWQIRPYGSKGDDDEQFVQTDLDRLGIGRPPPRVSATHHREQLQTKTKQQNQPQPTQQEPPPTTKPESPYASWDVRSDDYTPAPVATSTGKRAAPPSWLDRSPHAVWESVRSTGLIDTTVPDTPASAPTTTTSFAPPTVQTSGQTPSKENKKSVYASWDVRSEDPAPAASSAASAYTTADTHNTSADPKEPLTTGNDTPQAGPDAAALTTEQATGEEKKDGKIAVILKLKLGPGVYATMALRELMKEGGVREYGGGGRG
ncbi:MAG: hypothetical protein Q9218_006807 [Villophora microphyllina]